MPIETTRLAGSALLARALSKWVHPRAAIIVRNHVESPRLPAVVYCPRSCWLLAVGCSCCGCRHSHTHAHLPSIDAHQTPSAMKIEMTARASAAIALFGSSRIGACEREMRVRLSIAETCRPVDLLLLLLGCPTPDVSPPTHHHRSEARTSTPASRLMSKATCTHESHWHLAYYWQYRARTDWNGDVRLADELEVKIKRAFSTIIFASIGLMHSPSTGTGSQLFRDTDEHRRELAFRTRRWRCCLDLWQADCLDCLGGLLGRARLRRLARVCKPPQQSVESSRDNVLRSGVRAQPQSYLYNTGELKRRSTAQHSVRLRIDEQLCRRLMRVVMRPLARGGCDSRLLLENVLKRTNLTFTMMETRKLRGIETNYTNYGIYRFTRQPSTKYSGISFSIRQIRIKYRRV